jgi:hypothetical protein
MRGPVDALPGKPPTRASRFPLLLPNLVFQTFRRFGLAASFTRAIKLVAYPFNTMRRQLRVEVGKSQTA